MTDAAIKTLPANGIELCYESLGNNEAPTLLLIMGLGMQLLAWPDAFCQGLVDQGFRVIRFDNRDVGHSSKIRWNKRPNILLAMAAAWVGLPVRAPYLLDDMANDTIGLLDALHIERAHIIGASMGGMIAQCRAARYPDRLLSLTSIMSTTGNRRVSHGKPAVLRELLRRPARPDDVGSRVDQLIHLFGVIGSPGFPSDPDVLRQHLERGVRRSHYPAGQYHQLLAIIASGDRRRELAKIKTQTLVIHGADDPLVPVAAGRDTAKHIAGAQLQIIKGMGHDLPPEVQNLLLESIVRHCRTAELLAQGTAQKSQPPGQTYFDKAGTSGMK
jgi:proline iminopeptidase